MLWYPLMARHHQGCLDLGMPKIFGLCSGKPAEQHHDFLAGFTQKPDLNVQFQFLGTVKAVEDSKPCAGQARKSGSILTLS